MKFSGILIVSALLGLHFDACAQERVGTPDSHAGGEAATEALAKAAQNPVANLISVPFQNNFNFGIGPAEATQWVLNVQPVIPISLSEDWNLITRTIVPLINQNSPAPGIQPVFGLGDINPSAFFSPAKPGKIIWGIGPTLTLPTATDPMLGNELWSAGPAAVALTIQGPWVIGALMNQQWSFAGWGDEEVSALLLQPFINYNLPHGWYLTSSPILTANWKESAREAWVIPVGGGFGKIVHLGKLPLNCQLGAYWNIRTPTDGPDWQLRAQIQLLFPE
ncbi:MAG: neuromedin U [Verrucomicrobia bacterium]|nr:neuromedin U [Verrucomicrobiota bacterium]